MVNRGHSWSIVVIRGHSWSFVVTRGHSCVLLDKIQKNRVALCNRVRSVSANLRTHIRKIVQLFQIIGLIHGKMLLNIDLFTLSFC